MKLTESVGNAWKLAYCSSEILMKIDQNDLGRANPLPRHKSITGLPFNNLEVGQSIWIDMDECITAAWNAARLSCVRYNKLYGQPFVWKKHRGDARRSGFKFLEIARIK